MTPDTPETSLEDIRREIDAIDDGLLQLLTRRFVASAKVRATKKTDGSIATSPLRPAREAMMLRRLIVSGEGKVPRDVLVRLWRVILSASTQAQAPITVHLDPALAKNAGLEVKIAEHFCGMTRQSHADLNACLSALSRNPGDVAVVAPVSPWAAWMAAHAPSAISVIAALPVLATDRTPELLVFGHADPQSSGADESIFISRNGRFDSQQPARWQCQSGDWFVASFEGFLARDAIGGSANDVILVGRCPISIEVPDD